MVVVAVWCLEILSKTSTSVHRHMQQRPIPNTNTIVEILPNPYVIADPAIEFAKRCNQKSSRSAEYH